ncbi:MAG: hypothetical protein ABGY10_11885 [bacterium]|nr:hypothetical protein [Gemmatimonadota bacterium]
MFKGLFVFEKQRTRKEAFGFFLAYSLFRSVLSVIIIELVLGGASSVAEAIELGQAVGRYLNPLFCLVLSALILFRKGHLKSLGFVLIGLSSGVVGFFIGSFLGLIPTAYLTTIKPVDRVPDGNA